MALAIGAHIERYVVEALLGAGGMGEVYRAHDPRLQRSVALKILRSSAQTVPAPNVTGGSAPVSSNTPQRLIREARAAAALDHPNVVAIFDVGEVESPPELRGTTYIAMELIKGAPLRTYVGDARIPMSRRIAWLTDVARALAAAHAVGLVHRDIKPENVMVRDDGHVKVLDFGIAKRSSAVVPEKPSTDGNTAGTLTAEGVVLGTPLYMAPEHMRGEPIDGRADQFSWGVMAYELLAGRSPWSVEAGSLAVVSQILSAMPPPLVDVEGVPAQVATTVTRALAKDRGARFATIDELLAALGGSTFELPAPAASMRSPNAQSVAVHGTPVEGSRTMEGVPARPIVRKHSWMVPAIGALVAIVAAGSVGAIAVRRNRDTASVAPPAIASSVTPKCSNRACVEAHGGEPYVCRKADQTCVPIASEDCTPMYEPSDLLSDETVWIGSLFPTKGPKAEDFGSMNAEGVNFARKEIAQATSALEGANAATKVRPVALVSCDDTQDAMRAARHLVDDVGVPAIVGFQNGQEVTDLAGSLLIQRGVLAIASLSAAPQITRLPQPPALPRMVWRTTYSLDAVARAIALVLEGPLATKGAATRVTLARADVAADVSFADALYSQLHFNGKSALENGRDYQEVTFPNKPLSVEAVSRLADSIASHAPTFVVLSGLDAAIVALAQGIEVRSKSTKPTYVVAGGSLESFRSFAGSSSDRRHRLFAVDSTSNSNANARFVIRYNQAHTASVTREFNAGDSYDAFYLLAYSVFALGPDDSPSGASLARAFDRLVPPGASVEVGPSHILDALALLARGERIDLQGTQTSLDYDPRTGESPADFVLLCLGAGSRGQATDENVESGILVEARSATATGTLRCP